MDDHDGKIKYYGPDVKTSSFYSYKLKGPGLRTQIITDMNKMILFISKSEKCAVSNDGVMFLNMKLEEFIHVGDCLGMDGGYTLYIPKLKEKCIEIGKDISDKNFNPPIRKDDNVKLNIEELDYNKRFGSFRSEIENHFSLLASKFNRFNNNRAALQITDMKHYNLQFKVVCLLLNIWKMVKDYNIEVQPYHMLWYNDNFGFPKKEKKLDIIFNNKVDADKNYNEMFDLQQKLLNLDLNELHGAINYCKILHSGCKLSAKSYRAGFNIFKNRKLFNFLTFFFSFIVGDQKLSGKKNPQFSFFLSAIHKY
jgi:hypothetical protein